MTISIITVTYNRAYTIKAAIEGVLRQRFKNYEYIVVDGASNDNTVDILKEYEPKFEGRMRWISEPDKGLYDAINKGFKMAKGEIVGIINSDDFFHRDDTFDIIAKAFEDSNIDAIYAESRHERAEGVDYQTSSGKSFRRWKMRFGVMPSHQTFYAKRTLFEELGYYKTDYKITADFELLLRFIYINRIKVKYIPEALLTFSFGGVSTNMKNKMLVNKESVRACRENGLFCITPMIWIKYFLKFNYIVNIFK